MSVYVYDCYDTKRVHHGASKYLVGENGELDLRDDNGFTMLTVASGEWIRASYRDEDWEIADDE